MKLALFYFITWILGVEAQVCGIGSATSLFGSVFDNPSKELQFKVPYGTNRIIGGTAMPSGAFPWAVFLDMGCTGSIISANWILTAKHCTISANGIVSVYYGSTNRPEQVSQTSTTIFQTDGEDYFGKDIALIKLNTPIEFNENVSSICLSRSFRPKIGDKAVIAGFGYVFHQLKVTLPPGADVINQTHSIIANVPDELYAVTLTVIDSMLCTCNCTDPDEIPSDIQEETEICAGGEQSGTLGGDSGGPLMILDKDSMQWFQVGLTSGGSLTATGDVKRVIDHGKYTDVSKFCDWIEKTTNNEVLCSE